MRISGAAHSDFKRWIALTYPIFLGYVSVAFIFGVVAQSAGLSGLFAVLASLLLYAGAAQFLLVRLIQAAAPVAEVFTATFLLNLRHIFYYKPIEKKLPVARGRRLYSILAMTDETFAVLTESRVQAKDSFWIILLNHSYWVAGTALGVLLGGWLAAHVSGLDFALVALFIVLMVEKARIREDATLLLHFFVACSLCWLLLPPQFFLISSMGLCLLSVVGMDGWKQRDLSEGRSK